MHMILSIQKKGMFFVGKVEELISSDFRESYGNIFDCQLSLSYFFLPHSSIYEQPALIHSFLEKEGGKAYISSGILWDIL